jgi:hypothetical protein
MGCDGNEELAAGNRTGMVRLARAAKGTTFRVKLVLAEFPEASVTFRLMTKEPRTSGVRVAADPLTLASTAVLPLGSLESDHA